MSKIATFDITESADYWRIAGDVLIDNIDQILSHQNTFKLDANVKVDFSNVARADTAALSLMLEWQRRAVAAGGSVEFLNLPISLKSLAHLYGVEGFISINA